MNQNEERPISAPLKVEQHQIARSPSKIKNPITLKQKQLNQSYKQLQKTYDLSKDKLREPVRKKVNQNIQLNKTQLDFKYQIDEKFYNRKATESLKPIKKRQEFNPRASLYLKLTNLTNQSMEESKKIQPQKKMSDILIIEGELTNKLKKLKKNNQKFQLPSSLKGNTKQSTENLNLLHQKLEIYRETFDQVISRSGNFKGLLSKIKRAYEEIILKDQTDHSKSQKIKPFQQLSESKVMDGYDFQQKEQLKEYQLSKLITEQKMVQLVRENQELQRKLNQQSLQLSELKGSMQEYKIFSNKQPQYQKETDVYRKPTFKVKNLKKMQTQNIRKVQISVPLQDELEKREHVDIIQQKGLKLKNKNIKSNNEISIKKVVKQDSLKNLSESNILQAVSKNTEIQWTQDHSLEDIEQNSKSILNKSIPKLDLSNIDIKNQEKEQQLSKAVNESSQNQDHSTQSTQSSTGKLQLKFNQNQPGFHDEFMARFDEFSESWRNAILRNGR